MKPEGTRSEDAQRTLLVEGSVYALVEVAQQAATLLTLPLLFFYLSAEDFGVITAAVTASHIAMFLSTMGLDFTVMRLYYTWTDQDRESLTSGVAGLSLIWCLALGAAAVPVFSWFSLEVNVRNPLIVGVWSGLALGLRNVPLAVARVTGATRIYAGAELSSALTRAVLQLGLVAAGAGALGYMVGYAAGPFLSLLFLAPAGLIKADLRGARWRLDGQTWRYTWQVLPSLVANRFLALADRLVMIGWASLDALGVYGAASRFSTGLKLLTGGFKLAMAPVLSRTERDDSMFRAVFFGLSRLLLLTMLSIGSGLMLAVWCIQFTPWANHSVEIQRLVAVFVFAQFLSGFGMLWQLGFYYSTKPQGASVAGVSSSLALVGALLVLVPSHGALGAAGAQVIAALVNIAVLASVEARDRGQLRSWYELIALTALFLPAVFGMWWFSPQLQIYVLLLTFVGYGMATASMMWRLRQPGAAFSWARP